MDKLASQSIRNLRFPLCVAIVMVHSNISIYNESAAQNPIVNLFSNFFVTKICFLAVALFFFISGYVFFHEGEFNRYIFKKKIHNRIYSLIIPYILWNAICLSFIFFLQQLIPNFNLLVHKQISDFSISDFFMVFWNLQEISGISSDQMGPLVGQFWFIQCLLVYSLITPIIYFCIKQLGIIFIIILGILSMSGYIPSVPGFNIVYLFYFCLGAYFSLTKHNWYILPKYISFIFATYIVIYIIQQMTNCAYLAIVDETLLILGILNLTAYFTKGRNTRPINIYLSNASFFVFAIHRYFTSIGLNLTSHIVFYNSWSPILCFMAISTFSVVSSLIVYRFMDKYAHHLLLVLNGKRIKESK